MGCNCKANEKILKIHKDYGKKVNTPWTTEMTFKTGELLKLLLAGVIALLTAPVIFIFLIIRCIQGKTVININEVLRKFIRHKK